MKNLQCSIKHRIAIVLLSNLVAPAAFADDGLYVGLEGGINFLNGLTGREDGSSNGQPVVSTKFDLGSVAGLTGGYRFASGLRPEIELSYRRNDPRKITTDYFQADGIDGAKGHNDAYNYFANLWYDYRAESGIFAKLHPYVGIGAGVSRLALRRDRYSDRHDSRIDHDGYDSAFAYQAGAGVSYDLTRRLSLGLDYRFLQSNRQKDLVVQVQQGVLTRDTVYSRYRAQSLILNLRYSLDFGHRAGAERISTRVDPTFAEARPAPSAPAPVPSAPASAPPAVLRSVNFEFDRDQLTSAATTTLDEVAMALKANPGIAVDIVGHTDSIGSEPYNLALSQRRANAVLRYLAANGVDTSRFEIRGVGESDPVADNSTAEGRAENRRADFSVSAAAGDAAVGAPSTLESKAAAQGLSNNSHEASGPASGDPSHP